MQWLIDLIIEAIGVPPVFIDRGDPAGPDWTHVTLTADGAWHDLDISGIVPATASAALFGCFIIDNAVGQQFAIREDGNAQTMNISAFYTQVANITVQGDMVVKTSDSGLIEYLVSAGMNVVALSVRGWWL